MTDIVERLREDAFESWWQASKYCQVSHGNHRRIALDGWNAGTESLRQQVELWKANYLEQVELHNKTLDDLAIAERELAALKAGRNKPATEAFHECNGDEIADPVERLRFFCSCAMNGQDWLDVEPFFDALKAGQGEPVYYEITTHDGIKWVGKNKNNLPNHTSRPLCYCTSAPSTQQGEPVARLHELLGQYWDLAFFEGEEGVGRGDEANAVLHQLIDLYRSAPSIPEDWQLVPTPSSEWADNINALPDWSGIVADDIKQILDAAPKPGEKE